MDAERKDDIMRVDGRLPQPYASKPQDNVGNVADGDAGGDGRTHSLPI